jgi:hypothetical protein
MKDLDSEDFQGYEIRMLEVKTDSQDWIEGCGFAGFSGYELEFGFGS